MRGLTRRWLMAGDAVTDDASGGTPPPLLQRLLAARGLSDPESARAFCEPKLTDLHDPALMPGIDAAVTRLIDAVKRDEVIVIYGDYDVDGITAAAILYHVIRTVRPNAKVRTYVPHRLEEGYGINCEALKQLRREGADLVISVDCGITAAESARTALEIGLDLIITDHHNLPESRTIHRRGAETAEDADGLSQRPPADDEVGRGGMPLAESEPAIDLPDCIALVHPRLPGSRYPFGDLCGAGVAFKLAWRFATAWCNSERVSDSLQKTLLNMLPLAALGTIADVVPLVGENRVIASYGLRLIKQTSLPGLRGLIEAADLMDEHIDCQKVGFILGPRLNACGRMGHAGRAMRMLTDAPPDEAVAIARELTRINQQRQRTERDIFSRAAQLAEDAGMLRDDCRAIVLADGAWHPGVVGIVCSRLVDRFGRPAVLMQRNGETCKGSARSIDGYSIHAGLCTCAELLMTWGGHDMAAGLTLAAANLDAFTSRLTEHANERIAAEQLTPAIRIDCDAALSELDLETVRGIGSLSPFGRANRRPLLRISGAAVADPPRQIGQNGRHLSLRLREDGPRGRRVVRAVWWNAGQYAGDLAPGMRLDAAIEPKLNEWNGRVSVEAELKDIRLLAADR